jgi:hypothetical protein
VLSFDSKHSNMIQNISALAQGLFGLSAAS